MARIDILHLIDRVESLIGSGKRIPLVRKVVIDEERILDIIDQMRVSVPKDVMEAQQLLQEREGVLNQANLEAKRITTAAEEEYKAKLAENELVKAAQSRAQELVDEAKQKAEAILTEAEKEASVRKQEADHYTLETLRKLGAQLEGVLQSIRKGVETLERKKNPD